MKRRKYKTTRKYHCPYCNALMTRSDMIDHIEKEHEMMIPEGYSAAHVVYDSINKKDYGTCMICGAKVYEWDENICRYKNLCDDPRCQQTIRLKSAKNRLDDPEKQKQMLNGRKISGQYEFQDGTIHSYTGSYERKCWEFMDKVLNIKGTDLMIPGPVVDYEYEGEIHKWILDCLYIPAMLAMDIKDGGSNPNTRPMKSYREKQIAKEDAIVKQGKYNYLRLTDNDFSQLLYALADIKYGVMESDPEKGIYINEACPSGAMPSSTSSNTYIVPIMMKGMNDEDVDGYAFANTACDKAFYRAVNGDLLVEPKELLNETGPRIYFKTDKFVEYMNMPLNEAISDLVGFPMLSLYDMLYSENVACVEEKKDEKHSLNYRNYIKNAIIRKVNTNDNKKVLNEALVKTVGYVSVMMDDEGYYLVTPDDFLLVSPKFGSLEDISDETIQAVNSIYEKNRPVKGVKGNGYSTRFSL